MARVSFIELPVDQVAQHFYAAVESLIDSGTFDDEQHAADRIGVTLVDLLSWKTGSRVPPRILRRAAVRFGISPAFVHFSIGPPHLDRHHIFKIARMI